MFKQIRFRLPRFINKRNVIEPFSLEMAYAGYFLLN